MVVLSDFHVRSAGLDGGSEEDLSATSLQADGVGMSVYTSCGPAEHQACSGVINRSGLTDSAWICRLE